MGQNHWDEAFGAFEELREGLSGWIPNREEGGVFFEN